MPPEQRRRLIKLIFVIIIAIVILVGGQKVFGANVQIGTIVLMIALGAIIGWLANRRR